MADPVPRSWALILLRPGRTDVPGQPLPAMNRFTQADGLILARISPTAVLAMREGQGPLTLPGEDRVIDWSDARIALALRGPHARARLAHLVPLDLDAMRPGHCAQTIMAHLSVLLLQHAPDHYELQCGASFAETFTRAVDATERTVA